MKQLPIPPKLIDISGYFFGRHPVGRVVPRKTSFIKAVFFTIEEVDFLPIFSTAEKHLAAMAQVLGEKARDVVIVQIEDGADFLASVKGQVRVAIDPYQTPEGKTRWTEILEEAP